MNSTNSYSQEARSADSISDRALPKLEKYSYTKYDPTTIINFLLDVGGAVRMMAKAGDELEDFLDAKLERETTISLTRPKFLSDPDLEWDDSEEEDFGSIEAEPPAAAASTDAAAQEAAPDAAPEPAPSEGYNEEAYRYGDKSKYRNISPEGKKLDKKLYLMLQACITAPEIRSLLRNFQGRDARYTFAVMGIYEHVGY